MMDGSRLDGDWGLVKTKFPNGDADMKALVDQIHAQGFGAALVGAADRQAGFRTRSRTHPEELLLNADGFEAEDFLLERLVSLSVRTPP